jgi:hypothetical protein
VTAKAARFSTQRREDTKILKYFKVALADVSKLFIIRGSVFNTIYYKVIMKPQINSRGSGQTTSLESLRLRAFALKKQRLCVESIRSFALNKKPPALQSVFGILKDNGRRRPRISIFYRLRRTKIRGNACR